MKFFRTTFFFLFLLPVAGLQAEDGKDTVLTVKNIVVIGNERTKEHVILREMSLNVGDTITSTSIEYDRNRIYNLQLFNRVDIDYTVEGREATVFVRVWERWYIFPIPILGFKYRDTKKLYYGLGFVHNNFRGRNEKLMASFALGFDRWVSVMYQNPKLTENDDIFFRIAASLSRVQNQNVSQGLYNQSVAGVEATFGKRYGLHHSLLGLVGYRKWSVTNPAPGRTASATGVDEFVTIGGRYTYDARDLREYAADGSFVSFHATKLGVGESSVDLVRVGYDVRHFQPLGLADASLGVRMFGSFTMGGIVPSYLFAYFGYDERIRGHFKSVMEGEQVLGQSVELRVPLLAPRYFVMNNLPVPAGFRVWRFGVSLGVFADAGRIWFREQGMGSQPWVGGVGGGLHFLLPYSVVVRTEYAVNRNGDGEFVLDFGASF
jgi:outer membrane protein assembly factor BamA